MTDNALSERRGRLGVLVSLLLLPVVAAFAQDSPLALEEVLVTATKREASLQDVSVAVTALSADDLRDAQIRSSEELTFLVPSLTLQKGANPRATSFNIRGIGTQGFSSALEPSVSTMVDGVVMGRSGQAFMQMLDIARVEVLRGPQGTLFGKNSTAGVVHIITQDPTEEPSGEMSVTAVSDDEYRGGLTASGPISDSLGFRLSANGVTLDDYTKNYYDGNKLNSADEWSVRGKLHWLASDTLDLKWSSDYSDTDCDCTAGPIRSLEPFGGNEERVQEILDLISPVVPGDENKDVNINKQPFSKTESWGHSLEANWEVGDFTLTSISAYREWEVKSFGDVDSQPIDAFGFDQFGGSETEQFTQELRLTSPAEGAITYVAGLFYFDQHLERRFRREFTFGEDFEIAVADFEVDTTNWAAFGEAIWHFADDWRLILGARYTEDDLEFEFERSLDGNGVGLPDPVARTPGDTDEDDLSGKFALQWDFSDAGMTYVSYTEGYKGPAFDVAFGTDPVDLPRVDPETSEAWELGLKSSLFDDRVRFNAALFYAEYDDFQSQAFFDPDGDPGCPDDMPNCDPNNDPPSFILINAGKVTTEGLELDVLAQVTESLRLSGGAAFINAEIDDYPQGPCSGGQEFRGECPDGLQDLSGGDLPFSPDWKINLSASYTFFLERGFDVELIGSVRAQDDVLYSLSQDPNTIQDNYAVVDTSLVLSDHEQHWRATVFVKNVFDEFYVNSIIGNNGNILPNGYNHRYDKLAERTYGLEVSYSWF